MPMTDLSSFELDSDASAEDLDEQLKLLQQQAVDLEDKKNTNFKAQSLLIKKKKDSLEVRKLRHKQRIDKKKDKFVSKLKLIEKEKEVWRLEQKRARDINFEDEQIIELDVSGMIEGFKVTRELLTSIKGSLLEAKFSGRCKVTKTKEGRIFLDRNPKIFKHVIDYLRICTSSGKSLPAISDKRDQ